MRSKKLAVRFGLLTVLLVTLSLASTSHAWTICRVATPDISWYSTWRGVAVVSISCDTPGATIKYTWNGSSAQTYRYPLIVARDAVIKAWAIKTGCLPSRYIRILRLDFWPYEN